ncbi:MAG: hypothetical protein H0A76_12280 [Candidatus Thiodubiliella endoseptemdiera]|uniref:Uncharacterized protein n=1 Tax=Candidatus Thiodubiliella endoseptemdiera TaxID=2738886 RepID=A0A853F4W2_9GAMM|nr:hypothetical protein [Candidatus Thiodubiliella endoseptemdiera]
MKEYAPFISGVSEAFDARNLYVKVKKIQEGNYTNEIDKQTDINYVRSYLEELEELNIRGKLSSQHS